MCDECDALRERVDELAAEIEKLKQEREAYRQQALGPRLDELEAATDDAHAERAEVKRSLELVRDQVRDLSAEVESLIGLAENEGSTPAKRAADVRQALIRRARELGAGGDTTATMHYGEVQEMLADHGHEVTNKDACYQAMADAADTEGFWTEEDKKRKNGRLVRAVVVDTAKLPSSGAVPSSSDATTRNQGRGPRRAAEPTD